MELQEKLKANINYNNNGICADTLYAAELNIELLFKLLIVFQYKSLLQYEFLRLFFKDVVAKTYSCEWKRATFFKFVKIFTSNDQVNQIYNYLLNHFI